MPTPPAGKAKQNVQIWHNPRCSKSRESLELLRSCGVEPEQRLYLEDAPDATALRAVLRKLGLPASELVRHKDLAATGVAPATDEAGWLQLLVDHPKLIERPIVIIGDRAVLGRPAERVASLLAERG